jgi:hypothetical protein
MRNDLIAVIRRRLARTRPKLVKKRFSLSGTPERSLISSADRSLAPETTTSEIRQIGKERMK